jgi:hypothetical protein
MAGQDKSGRDETIYFHPPNADFIRVAEAIKLNTQPKTYIKKPVF